VKQFRMRLVFVSVLLSLACLTVAARLFTIQIIDGERYALRGKSQAQQRRIINAKRGNIYDRRGNLLASSVPGQLSMNVEMLGMEGGLPGSKAVLQRIYPNGDVGGSVLGHVGRDGYGLGGVEFSFDHYLRGEDGWEMIQKDGKHRAYRKIGLPGKEPRDGADLYLTIDINIQRIVQSVLKQTVESLNAKGAMGIVMDPHTGKILAMANEPSFNPNLPASFTLAQRQNKCISQIYEPGSTFKLVTAAVALQERLLTENDLIDGNNGIFEIYGEIIRDDVPQQHITFTRAMAVSSNVCFARIANGFGNDLFYRYNRDFGFGSKTGVSLPGEEEGILHPVRSWSGRTRVTMAMGYEVSATFLQMMLPYASAANGGVLMSPLIYERVERQNGTVVIGSAVKPVRRVVSEDVAARLRAMLAEVVISGTGRQAAVPGVSAAGKTGTSRKPEAGGYSRTRHWSSFIGFLPADNPVLLCGIVIDEPVGLTGGGAAAAPAFRKIMSQVLAHPELEFSQKVLKKPVNAAVSDSQSRSARMPDFSGRSVSSVSHQLDSLNIAFRVEGQGGVVLYQMPAAGSLLGRRGVVLFTEGQRTISDGDIRVVPDGVGKDLRDAFNIFNSSGISVYAVGSGVVNRQSIAAGKIVSSSEVCTLFSSRPGVRK